MNYQLSIVIPVFNSEQYLPRLFKSLGEVPPEVEIILVNNGSTDNSARLLQHYHETHADTVIIDENRRGVAFARNTGLDNSNGKYVWFIDADDVLLPGAVNRILRVIKGTGFDLLVFDYLSLVEKDKVPKEAPAVKKAEKTKLADILHEMLTGAHDPIGGFPHNKVFARKLIGTERFENLQYAEDLAFFLPILLRANNIYRLHDALYVYYQHAGSIAHKINTEKLTDYAKVVDEVERVLSSSDVAANKDVDEYILRRRLSIYFQNIAASNDLGLKRHIRDKMAQYSFKKLMLYKKDKKLVIKMLLYKFRVLDIFPFLLKYVY